ncbi:hypothetical protein [Geomonas azotofigens]|uniref:hypothetical protein n=1 Tax=Geomonas azotofigens TaxID=2843196 RepID=UPI001C11630A|nr:hypothetical protein [Geomonas azotofigens]MBU5613853.1 hypothetical protein [Geomonas azotofigens]
MPITNKMKIAYASVVLLIQVYLVYAATLYVTPWSAGFLCVLVAAAASAAGALYYIFVVARDNEIVAYNPQTFLEERRRIG